MNKKRVISVMVVIVVGAVLILGAISLNKKRESERLAEEQRIALTYRTVNRGLNATSEIYYVPFVTNENSQSDVRVLTYLRLTSYRQITGNTLTYDMVVDFFSQEYEDDGSLRLYNNGLHLEIEEYILWIEIEGNLELTDEYIDTIGDIYYEYYSEHEGYMNFYVTRANRETLDELIKKEADPTYEMDLMSIQQREHAEAGTQEAA
jgi:hypothetical protein